MAATRPGPARQDQAAASQETATAAKTSASRPLLVPHGSRKRSSTIPAAIAETSATNGETMNRRIRLCTRCCRLGRRAAVGSGWSSCDLRRPRIRAQECSIKVASPREIAIVKLAFQTGQEKAAARLERFRIFCWTAPVRSRILNCWCDKISGSVFNRVPRLRGPTPCKITVLS